MNAPDRVTTWFPRAGSLAERVLAWLPLQPGASATAVQIAAALGVTRAPNVHAQLSSAVAAGVLDRIIESEPHVYRMGSVQPAPRPDGSAPQVRPSRAKPQQADDYVVPSGPMIAFEETIGWVKCSAGLPAPGQKVLVRSGARKLERVTQGMYLPAREDRPAAWREVTFVEIEGVTHWAAMPGGPKR